MLAFTVTGVHHGREWLQLIEPEAGVLKASGSITLLGYKRTGPVTRLVTHQENRQNEAQFNVRLRTAEST